MTTELKNRSIRELAPKPSDAIKAMLAGLRDMPSDSFHVNMGTFGRVDWDSSGGRYICCGCAATCAVFKLAGKVPTRDSIYRDAGQALYLGLNFPDIVEFENAIDAFRVGNATWLLRYYHGRLLGIPDEFWGRQFWYMSTDSWKTFLPQIEEYVAKLEAAGF